MYANYTHTTRDQQNADESGYHLNPIRQPTTGRHATGIGSTNRYSRPADLTDTELNLQAGLETRLNDYSNPTEVRTDCFLATGERGTRSCGEFGSGTVRHANPFIAQTFDWIHPLNARNYERGPDSKKKFKITKTH